MNSDDVMGYLCVMADIAELEAKTQRPLTIADLCAEDDRREAELDRQIRRRRRQIATKQWISENATALTLAMVVVATVLAVFTIINVSILTGVFP